MWVIEMIDWSLSMGNKTYERNKTKLEFSKKQVSKAGECIRKNDGNIEQSLKIIQNFRAAHSYPLMIINTLICRCAQKIKPVPIVARRLKRLPTIVDKLTRETLDGINANTLNLSRLQDIGGCRIIVHDQRSLIELDKILDKSKTVHTTIKKRDYLKNPKDTGYRGIHRIYKTYEKKTEHDWKNFLIEVQIRTKLQHVWATTVEIIDVIENNHLKTNPFSADHRWLEFFKIMSELFAEEEHFITLTTNQQKTNKDRLVHLNAQLHIMDKLQSFNTTFSIQKITKQAESSRSIILIIDSVKKRVSIRFFDDEEKAIKMYNIWELEEKDKNIVLIEMDNIKNIQKAYPNYLIDTSAFIEKFKNYMDTYYWSK